MTKGEEQMERERGTGTGRGEQRYEGGKQDSSLVDLNAVDLS